MTRSYGCYVTDWIETHASESIRMWSVSCSTAPTRISRCHVNEVSTDSSSREEWISRPPQWHKLSTHHVNYV